MYDYVIVGAGSAGCVIAGRLSEDRDVRVALLEAGGQDGRPEIAMPIAFPMLLKSSVDWDLYGEQEPGLGGRRLFLPRGKVLGGSGSINAMIYIRGNRADYDGWAAGGAAGLELRRGPALLQALGGQRTRGGRISRRGRAAERRRQSCDEPADRDDARGRRALGPRLQPGLQRRPPGGRRALPAHAAQRPAALDGGRVHPPGGDAAESRRHHRCAGAADPLRGHPRGRRRGLSQRRGRAGQGATRGDPLGRVVSVARAPDDLGHRARRGSRAVRHGGAREPAGRPQPAGPLHVPAQLRDRRAVAVRGVRGRQLRAASRARDAVR